VTMRRFQAMLCAATLLALPGCRADVSDLRVIGVEDLARLSARGGDLTICDANGEATRRRFGVVPGAVLLSSYRDYDPATELPGDRDRTLVFYCYNEFCSAAAGAARKAVGAGYRDVRVMHAGIEAWVEAGQPVDTVARTETES